MHPQVKRGLNTKDRLLPQLKEDLQRYYPIHILLFLYVPNKISTFSYYAIKVVYDEDVYTNL